MNLGNYNQLIGDASLPAENYRSLIAYCRMLALHFVPGDIVLIGGLSRSGKTTFANSLRSTLLEQGKIVWTLSIDRWLKDLHLRSPGVLGRYDISTVCKVIDIQISESLETQILELPEYHKLQQSTIKTGESIIIQPKDILIVEGTIALTLAREVKKIHRFFIEIDETVRRSRVIEEYLKRGKTQLQAETIYSERQIDESPVIMQSAYGSVHLNLMTLTEHP